MMDSSQTPRAWVAECGITAATLDGRRTGEVYEEYVAYTQAQKRRTRLSAMAIDAAGNTADVDARDARGGQRMPADVLRDDGGGLMEPPKLAFAVVVCVLACVAAWLMARS